MRMSGVIEVIEGKKCTWVRSPGCMWEKKGHNQIAAAVLSGHLSNDVNLSPYGRLFVRSDEDRWGQMERRATRLWSQASDPRPKASDLRPPVSSLKPQTSGLKPQASDHVAINKKLLLSVFFVHKKTKEWRIFFFSKNLLRIKASIIEVAKNHYFMQFFRIRMRIIMKIKCFLYLIKNGFPIAKNCIWKSIWKFDSVNFLKIWIKLGLFAILKY